jgi:fucose permease
MYVNTDNLKGDKGKTEIYNLLLLEASVILILVIPVTFLYREKPKSPPSETSETKKISWKISLPQLFKKRDYTLMILLYMVMEAQSIYMLINMGLILEFFDVGNSLYSITFICVGGFIGAFFHGFIVKRLKIKKKFKFIMVLDTILTSILFPIMNLCFYYQKNVLLLAV